MNRLQEIIEKNEIKEKILTKVDNRIHLNQKDKDFLKEEKIIIWDDISSL